MSAVEGLPGLGGRRRPSLRVKLRTQWKASELDDALARGTDPLASDELTLRAQQLVEPDVRERLARTLEVIVEHVSLGGPAPVPGPTILRRKPIAASCPTLLALARRLRGDGPHCLRGLAMADRMVGYGDSPLYLGQGSGQLQRRVDEILEALDPGIR